LRSFPPGFRSSPCTQGIEQQRAASEPVPPPAQQGEVRRRCAFDFGLAAKSDPTPALPCLQGREQQRAASEPVPPPAQQEEVRRRCAFDFGLAAKSNPTPALPCLQGREQQRAASGPVPPPAQQGEVRRGCAFDFGWRRRATPPQPSPACRGESTSAPLFTASKGESTNLRSSCWRRIAPSRDPCENPADALVAQLDRAVPS
jgi:hypothetical protein